MNDEQSQEMGVSRADGAERLGVAPLCTRCGADLRAQPNEAALCMHCGHSVAESMRLQLPALDAEGRIAEDLSCVSCGYNLRMQPLGGICPECAAPVASSAKGHYLRHASPRWVRKLAEGTLQLALAVGVFVVVYVLAMLASALSLVSEVLLGALGLALGIVCLWLTVAGVWRLTAPEPGSEFRQEGFTSRKLTRWALLAIPLFIILGAGFSRLAPALGGPMNLLFQLLPILGAASLIACLLLPLALLRHVIGLMRRVPRPGLILFAKIEFWAGLACGILAAFGYIFMIFSFYTVFPAPGAGGPNMPATPYATGPNALVGAAAAAPASTSLGYTSRTTTTLKITTPNGVTTTTTTNAPGIAMPRFPRWFMAVSVALMIGGCGGLLTSIGGVVLLIMAWSALVDMARLAEAHAARLGAGARGASDDAPRVKTP